MLLTTERDSDDDDCGDDDDCASKIFSGDKTTKMVTNINIT